jgi:hypothetical protein
LDDRRLEAEQQARDAEEKVREDQRKEKAAFDALLHNTIEACRQVGTGPVAKVPVPGITVRGADTFDVAVQTEAYMIHIPQKLHQDMMAVSCLQQFQRLRATDAEMQELIRQCLEVWRRLTVRKRALKEAEGGTMPLSKWQRNLLWDLFAEWKYYVTRTIRDYVIERDAAKRIQDLFRRTRNTQTQTFSTAVTNETEGSEMRDTPSVPEALTNPSGLDDEKDNAKGDCRSGSGMQRREALTKVLAASSHTCQPTQGLDGAGSGGHYNND